MSEPATRHDARPHRSSRHSWARALPVPLLSVAAITCLVASLALSTAHIHHQSDACRYMAVPWTHFATAYGSLLAAVSAPVVHVLTSRAARRGGIRPASGGQSWIPTFFAVIAGFVIPLAALVVVLTHQDAGETAAKIGMPLCEGQAASSGTR
ncbi:hypothetical protein [Streptomyces sp. NPDC048650]|uniref:hypothetical protein n=1 Tax=unclassified Streptomyces TaxID=2593676 RepID=UPI0037190857